MGLLRPIRTGSLDRDAACATRRVIIPNVMIPRDRVLLFTFAALSCASPTGGAAARGAIESDEDLWSRMVDLRATCDRATSPEARPDATLAGREELLRQTRSYLSLYPGGRRRDAAQRLELETLFEIGALRGGDWAALRSFLEAQRATEPSAATVEEFAWWSALLASIDAAAVPDATALTTSKPASIPAGPTDARDVAANQHEKLILADDQSSPMREFSTRFPAGRHAATILRRLFDQAERAADLGEMQRVAVLAAQRGPDDITSALLTGRIARVKSVGQPFELSFELGEGEKFSTTKWVGKPIAILVWDSRSDASMRTLREIEAMRRGTPDLEAVGVNLDADPREMRESLRAAQISWPQFNDSHGRANAFARAWGVERTPIVFIVDRQGHLAGAVATDDWKARVAAVAAP